MDLWDAGNKGDACEEVSKKRKPSPKLLLEAKCTPPSRGYGENLSRPYCASQVINTAQTIVAKNGERARSRIVLPGQRSSCDVYTCMYAYTCVRACDGVAFKRRQSGRCEARAVKRGLGPQKRVASEAGTVKGRHCDAPGDRSHDRPGQGRAPCRVPKREQHTLRVHARVCPLHVCPCGPFLHRLAFPSPFARYNSIFYLRLLTLLC